MTTDRTVVVHPDRDDLARAVARRFLRTVSSLLATQDRVDVVLTGGTVGIAVLAAIAESDDRDSVEWSRVHLWWGDDRWVGHGHPDRNDQQARDALINALPAHTPVHAFPASDEGYDLSAAAARYDEELRREGSGNYPRFDITFLGVGPDGHVASLFPDREGPRVMEPAVIAVHDSPKPPPQRLSLTLPLINGSERVWLVLGGADKAAALGLALAGASVAEVPVAGVAGRSETVFFVDRAAAAEVPESLLTTTEYWTSEMDQPDWSPTVE